MSTKTEEDYKKELRGLTDVAVREGGIGALPMREILLEEAARCLFTAQNTLTIENSIGYWMDNFKSNLEKHFMFRDCSWFPKKEEGGKHFPAMVVGNGPSLTDGQIDLLKDFEGVLIATNKSLSKLLRNDVEPDFIAVLHTTDDIAPHFSTKEVKDYIKRKGEILESGLIFTTCLHPKVIYEARNITLGPTYWCNPGIPEEQVENIGYFMEMVTGLPTFDTGGNVGLFGMLSAVAMGCNPIGILGMDHAFVLDSKWTTEQALGYRIEYDPEDLQTYAIPPTFQTYLDSLVKYWRYYEAKGTKIINLSSWGPLYARRKSLVPYMELGQFVKG